MIDALPLLLGPEGYQISRSVRLRSSASAYFNRTPASAGNQKTWTWSGWVKRGTLNADQTIFCARQVSTSTPYVFFGFNVTTDILAYNSSSGGALYTTQVFRDPSAWYHIVYSVDTTQATAANRIKLYVNGVQVTSFSTATYPALNADTGVNTAIAHWIGAVTNGAGTIYTFLDGYLTEINFIDGQALTPSSFGETNTVTGVWQPKKYAGTYGTNGFYLNFSDNSAATAAAIGKDYSGNGNNWTPNNISVTAGVTYDSMLDVPTQWADGGNGRGNYATLNPVANPSTLLNANLTTNAGDKFSISTIGMTTGKWYCEVTVTTVGAESSVGISTQPYSGSNPYVGGTSTSWGYYSNNGNKYTNASNAAYGATYTTGDVIGIAFDADNGTLEFFKNNTSQGTAYTGLTSGPYFFAVEGRTTTSANNCSINFGQRPFAYTPPSGFKALNTLNLPTPTILKGNQYFDATLWDGNSTNARVITTNVGTVDFAWVKKRNGADDHRLANTVTGGNRHLKSNSTDAESTGTTVIQAFSGSTFTLGTDGSVNATGGTYVGWTWQAGGAAVTNTAGSISSQVSAGGTQGFSVVTYTGTGANATVGHGLGVAPKMIIFRARSIVENWPTWHTNLTSAAFVLTLNTTNAQASVPQVMNSTTPTSSVFSVGTSTGSNGNGTTYVAYLFAEVAGFSKFGSYTGNASADGPFVFCGFRPRFVLFKRTDSATGGEWAIYDSSRNLYNACNIELYPSNSSADETAGGASMDLLSNGFKIRNSRLGINASGGTYIFAAFAENPLKFSLAR